MIALLGFFVHPFRIELWPKVRLPRKYRPREQTWTLRTCEELGHARCGWGCHGVFDSKPSWWDLQHYA